MEPYRLLRTNFKSALEESAEFIQAGENSEKMNQLLVEDNDQRTT